MPNIASTPEGESETLLTGPGGTPPEREPEPPPEPRPPRGGTRPPLARRIRRIGRSPFLLLAAYYVVLIAVGAVLVQAFPVVRDAFVQPAGTMQTLGESLLRGERVVGTTGGEGGAGETLDRILTTLLVILGALALVLPVAWVYMRIKRFRYDPALVRSVVILPIVVAGIALVVKDSVALAFALAGIVAAVRFRNTLKDPRDAVYIFLVIGIGLSAGVQVLDVALVMSLLFNVVVLLLWRYNVGSVYTGRYARTGVLSVGDPALMAAQSPEAQRRVRRRLLDDAKAIKADGILLIHTADPEVARYTVQDALEDVAKDWKLVDVSDGARGAATLEYVLRLKKKASPPALIGALDERWSAQVESAEFVPFRKRKRKRKKEGPITHEDQNA